MLLDVTPGGQYADTAHIDQWSIFRANGSILQYQSPMYHYLDANGQPDTVNINGNKMIPNNLDENDFITYFKPSWANALLPDHPEYGWLGFLKFYITRSNYDWDNDFNDTKTFREAYAKGYLNPTGDSSFVHLFSSIELPINPSPPIMDSFYLYPEVKTNIRNRMLHYAINGSDTLSIWGLASATGYCAAGDSACVISNQHYPFADTSSCRGDADMAWRAFAGLYSSCKVQATIDFLAAHTTVPPALSEAFANGTHISRFTVDLNQQLDAAVPGINLADNSLATMTENKSVIQALQASQYHANCAAYASIWWSELAPCTTQKLLQDSAAIMSDLVAVCVKGSDVQHTNGSSSISPDSSNAYNSFDEVLVHYVNQYNAAHGDTDQISPQACNGELILAPQAYNAPQTFVNALVYGKPDSCQCGLISGLYDQYSALGSSYTSFSDYLQATRGTRIPESALDSLVGLCRGTITCNYLTTPIVVPPSLQCGGAGTCLDCSAIRELNGEFENLYPGMAPAGDLSGADSAQEAANRFYEQFMNSRTGFRKQAADYLNFLATCTGTTASRYDSLQKILGDFKSRNLSDIPAPDSVHFHLSPFFDDNTRVLTNYYSQAFSNGVAHISHDLLSTTPYSGDGIPMEKDDTLCVNNDFTIEARFKGDSAGFASSYCKNVNFIFWDTYPTIAVSPTFEATGAPGECGKGLVFYNNGSSSDTVNLGAYTRDLLDWMVLKMQFKNNVVKLYINDTLIRTASYPFTINRITRYALGSNCGYLDYVKVYDSLGNLQYKEEFEDCKQSPSNYPRAFSCDQDCHQAFTSFFNQRMHSSYSYTQVDSIYRSDCGYPASFACDSSFSLPVDTSSASAWCNQALLFNGDTSRRRIMIPLQNNRLNLDSGTCTFELRIKPRLPASYNILPLLSNRTTSHGPVADGFVFLLRDDGNILLQLQGCPHWLTSSTPGVNLFDGKSHLVTAVKDVDSVAFYIDGVLMPSFLAYCGGDATTPYHSRNITTMGPYYVGYDSLGTQPTPNANYNGWISEVRIWNTARTDSAIAANVHAMLSPQPGLVGYYLLHSHDTCEQYIQDLSPFASATATLDGRSSTGTITSYAWSLVSGPNNPVITHPDSALTTVTGLVAGTYVFRLSVNGDSSISQVIVHVGPEPPVYADAGPNRVVVSPSSSATLDGSRSSGPISSYAWTLVSGPDSPLIVSPGSVSTAVTGLTEGSYIFRLSVNGGSSTAEVKVDVVGLDTAIAIFADETPAGGTGNDGPAIELGVKFRSSRAGFITGIRFYKTTGNNGTHIGELYSSSGTRLAQATFSGETGTGWQTVSFPTPVAIQADTTYVAAYFSSLGNYTSTAGYFDEPETNDPLTGLADGTDGPNGLYAYADDDPVFPVASYQQSNYWVDVLFSNSSTAVANAGSGQIITLPASTVTLNGRGSVGVINNYAWTQISGPGTAVITHPDSAVTTVTGLSAGIWVFQLSVNSDSSTSQVRVRVDSLPGAVADAGENQAIVWPASSATLDGSASTGSISSYAWTLVSGPNSPTITDPGAVSTTVTGLVRGSYIFQLSVNGDSSSSQVRVDVLDLDSTATIFTTEAPAGSTGNDGQAIELGVKFRSSIAGYATGVRFYKTPGNDGTHIGELYSSSGARLAQATFTDETDSGWQTVSFSRPVAITPGITYVAAYFSSAGNYTYTDSYFGTAETNGPLTALADGTDGPNGLYSYGDDSTLFPSHSYEQSNYWVDVVFASSRLGAANAGPNQTVALSTPAPNHAVRGTGPASEYSDPVWLSGPQISFDSADPVGVANGCACYDTLAISCDSLATILDDATCQYHSLSDSLVNRKQCGIPNWFTGGILGNDYVAEDEITNPELISGGYFNQHSYGQRTFYTGLTYLSQRSFCVANEYAVEARVKNPMLDSSGHSLSCGDVYIILSTHSINTPPDSVDEDPMFAMIPYCGSGYYQYHGIRTYDTALGNPSRTFEDFHVIKLKVTTTKAQFYYDSVLVKEIPRDGLSYIDKINQFVVGTYFAKYLQMDWFKIYGPNDHLIFYENFDSFPAQRAVPDPDSYCPMQDCHSFFASYFNSHTGMSLTYDQIRDLYRRKCGVEVSLCPEPYTGPTLCPDADSVLPELAPTVPAACADTTSYAAAMATNLYSIYSDSVKGSFDSAYIGKCLEAASQERLTMLDSVSEYHYTLYYYDQAGNLVKTVPPAGVQRIYRQGWLDSVRAARLNGTSLTPDHRMATHYRYNTLNQVVAQQTPDAGRADFWYDRLGRLSLSRNAKQLAEGNNYSYTLYDAIGRITEVGQINGAGGTFTDSTTKVPSNWQTWLANNSTNRYQVTTTVYDLPGPSGIAPWLAQNASTLRNRVSYSTITPGQQGSDPTYGTYYNYDIEGNVSSLLQDYGSTGPMGESGQQYKRIDYDYDLVSGKVNSVAYQRGKPDAFMHFYRYDAENRLTDVYTTADSVTVEHEAHYDYYKHGPLARALIGQNQVQGLDYAYTLQGWLKAVNGSVLDSVYDMGHDGDPAVPSRQYTGKDAYGFSLHYYEGDYYPINGTAFLAGLKAKLGAGYRGLYNGNISSMAVNVGILNAPKLYNYHYDQLNRLTGMDVLNGTNTGLNLWSNNLTATNDYQEQVSYDGNGNILSYTRNGYGGTPSMDNLTYHYNAGTNQLNHISDAVASGNYPNDLDDQSSDNYSYDETGNLIQDVKAGITSNMTWSVYGKLLTIPSKGISYQYDAAGNRIGKTVGTDSTWYVRDAQGNVLAVYGGSGMALQEQDLYGSSRLGMVDSPAALANTPQYLDGLGSGTLFTFTRGKKLFELTNHLGNVLATISDKKFGTAVSGIPSQISYYSPDIRSVQDYYPFGMEMPGRSYNATYPYGFNGQEKSIEINSDGNSYTAQFWEYDSRLGRRWNLDPKPTVGISEYSAFNGNPIWFSDILGDSSRPGFWGGVLDFAEGAGGAIKSDAKGLWNFATKDAWKGKTWSELGKNAFAFGAGSTPAGSLELSAIDAKFGSDLQNRSEAIQNQIDQTAKDIPNMNAKDWGSFTGHVAFAIAGTKGVNLASKGLGALNRFAAIKYLTLTGDLEAFQDVEGFTLRLGSRDFIYHNSLEGAIASRWSTPTLFSSSEQAIENLALRYPGSSNTAMIRYSSRNFGFFVKGTVAPQGFTLGGGTQFLKTPFTLKRNVKWNEFIHFRYR
jgi:hypothetical protein